MKNITEEIWAQMDDATEEERKIAKDTKWLPGLSEAQLLDFEQAMGFTFPAPLRNLYRVMNGFDRPYTNKWEDTNGTMQSELCYGASSYPRDLDRIRKEIKWIYDDCYITPAEAHSQGISRIFPVWWSSYIMIDEPGHPTLNMAGNDITFMAQTLAADFTMSFLRVGRSGRLNYHTPIVRFWFPALRGSFARKVKKPRKRSILARQLRQLKKRSLLRRRAMG